MFRFVKVKLYSYNTVNVALRRTISIKYNDNEMVVKYSYERVLY